MAGTITFAVSCTPSEVVQSEDGVTNIDIISGEVASSLGGSGSAVVTSYLGSNAYQGIGGSDAAPGVRLYREADDNNNTTDISAEATASFVFIKNTGKLYSTPSVLGAALTASVKVMIGTTMISVLDAGEAIVLKDDNLGIACTGIHVRTVTTAGADDNTLGHLAVEFLVVD